MKTLVSLSAGTVLMLGCVVPAFASTASVNIVVPSMGCDAQTLTITGSAHIHPNNFLDTDYLVVVSGSTTKHSTSFTRGIINQSTTTAWSFTDTYGVGTHIVQADVFENPTTNSLASDTETFAIAPCPVVPSTPSSNAPSGSRITGGGGYCKPDPTRPECNQPQNFNYHKLPMTKEAQLVFLYSEVVKKLQQMVELF